jgi:hypothetical protein
MENTNTEKYRLYLYYNREKESDDIPDYLEDEDDENEENECLEENDSEKDFEKETEEQIKELSDTFKNDIENYSCVVKVEQIKPGDYIITVDTDNEEYEDFEDNMEEEFGRYGNVHGWGYGEFIDYSMEEITEKEEKELLENN